MERDTQRGVEKYTKARQMKKLWYRVMSFLAAVVVFCTTYALILPAVTQEGTALTGDDAYVSSISVVEYSDGVAGFDGNNDPGNDSGPNNKIVRTFDTVTYRFKVDMLPYNSDDRYTDARVKLEFVLPLTSEQAEFVQSSMGWMDQTTGYEPKLTEEIRKINNVATQCQVLTCYKRLSTTDANKSVVPGDFTENLTIKVKSMKNGDTFAPIISAAMEHSKWDGVWVVGDGENYPTYSDTLFSYEGSYASPGGDGTESNPYIINTAEQLYQMVECGGKNENVPAYYVLNNDIVFNETDEWLPDPDNTKQYNVWTTPSVRFEGNFNGNGYTISNLYIKGNGFINEAFDGAVIKNVRFENVYVSGISWVGTLFGNVHAITVSNVMIINSQLVRTDKNDNSGGITGYVEDGRTATFSNCAVIKTNADGAISGCGDWSYAFQNIIGCWAVECNNATRFCAGKEAGQYVKIKNSYLITDKLSIQGADAKTAMPELDWAECLTHKTIEKKTVTAEEITVSAAPKYNIQLKGDSSYKATFNFNSGNEIAQSYGEGYGKGSVVGRAIKMGITLQIYNDNSSKGFKGIELPNGTPITFDIKLDSKYTIDAPNPSSTYNSGETVKVNDNYKPLLWSCDANSPTAYGETNADDRIILDSYGAQALAPWNKGSGNNSCYDGGNWSAVQNGNTVSITVKDYDIDVDNMPLKNGDGVMGAYGEALGIGCFSAGELWIVQPYNKIGETGENQGPDFDIVKDYGQGHFTTTIEAINMKATSLGGTDFSDPEGTNDKQIIKTDDKLTQTVAMGLSGAIQNRVAYSGDANFSKGVGTDSQYNGLDIAFPGTELYFYGGFSYSAKTETDNLLYWGTNLTKFYGSAFKPTGEEKMLLSWDIQGKGITMEVLYATKEDGSDWENDYELQHTYEDDLVFYDSVEAIPSKYLCVGILYCFKGPGIEKDMDLYFAGTVGMKLSDDMSQVGNTYMLASTSRVWTKSMFENDGRYSEAVTNETIFNTIPDWKNPETKLSDFPIKHYISANIDGSAWYEKQTYAADGSGPSGGHNSEWAQWGDTLLVVSVETNITKTLMQTDSEGTKTTFNLDSNQRVVDFKLQPSIPSDQVGMSWLTTTVTIVDTLPEYLKYRPGSSVFDGEYAQSSTDGGTQGTITGGTLTEPDDIKNNEDGTQTIIWIIKDVDVGSTMPTIYYSADIGDQSDPSKDVLIGTTHLLNKVRISAEGDLRQPSAENGNYDEKGITVVRGAASSYGKYSKQNLVEPDGEINYVIYHNNNSSATDNEVVLLDTMPYNGKLDNAFTGSYTVKSWKIDSTKCDPTQFKLYYITDANAEYAGKTLVNGITKEQIEAWNSVTINSAGTLEDESKIIGQKPVAWALIGSLESSKSVYVDMTIKLNPGASNGTNNVYHNVFSNNNTSIPTTEHSVIRTIEGLTWLDENADGVQDNDETRLSGVKVSLWKLKAGGDASNEEHYEEYCYPSGEPIVIEMGQQTSVFATGENKTTIYQDGFYKFTDLPAGIFAVKFVDGISDYIASPADKGSDYSDSDGIAQYSNDRSTLLKTVILGIELPTADTMNVALYESKYHDSGFYERGYELPKSGGKGTDTYTYLGLTIWGFALLAFVYRKARKTFGKSK